MDLFKYKDISSFSDGESINGWESISWIERYRDPGAFELKARLSSGLKDFLPIGTVISHAKTLEIMIVENHEVIEDVDEDPSLKITGRSFDSYLEQRVVGANQNWASPPAVIPNYTLLADEVWYQVEKLINDHLDLSMVINASDGVVQVKADTSVSFVSPTTEERVIKRGNLHTRVLELLAVGNLGIRTSRPHTFYNLFGSPTFALFIIHDGSDQTDDVIFSTHVGDLSTANYLWTNKKDKNAALISGKFVETMLYGVETGYDRRVMFVDANDIDGSLQAVPIGAELDAIKAAMITRGKEALENQKHIVLTRSDVSDTQQYEYRVDYRIGDQVTVHGSFGEILEMRVIEFVEIEDKDGYNGHPTLAIIDS